MKALVYTAPSTVEVLDVPRPTPAQDETIVTVAAAGICGSELHGISTPGFRTPPLVMGHEFAGVVDGGKRVVVNPIVSCGACDLCRAGGTQLCRHRAIVGIHRPGAFAEEVAVPHGLLHPLPEQLTWDQAAMVEPLANAVHAARLAEVGPGQRVGVIGAGTIGLVCLLVAAHYGAGPIAVADLSPDRLELAKRLGASRVGPELDGEFDVVFDAVGAAATHAAGLRSLRPGGTAVWLGLMGTDPAFDAQDLIRTEKRVLGSFAYTDQEFAAAIDLAPQCDLSWVTACSLTDSAEVFTDLMNGRTDIVKAIVHP